MGKHFRFDMAESLLGIFKPRTIALSGGKALDKTVTDPIIHFFEKYNLKCINISEKLNEGAIHGLSTLFDKKYLD